MEVVAYQDDRGVIADFHDDVDHLVLIDLEAHQRGIPPPAGSFSLMWRMVSSTIRAPYARVDFEDHRQCYQRLGIAIVVNRECVRELLANDLSGQRLNTASCSPCVVSKGRKCRYDT